MKTIRPMAATNASVTVPGSKSLTHRMFIAAALSDGPCTVENALDSEDTRLTLHALGRMGIASQRSGGTVAVSGTGGAFSPCSEPIDLGNSGTSMRLMTAVAALGPGPYTLTGTARMRQRPIQDLLDALNRMGVRARSTTGTGCPPVEVRGGGVRGGRVPVDCSVSSQFLSALLLIAPRTTEGLTLEVTGGPVSKPYVDLTVEVLERFGVRVDRSGYTRFRVDGGQSLRPGAYTVEPDLSQAGYFWAAAAVSGARITVRGIGAGSRQGDIGFLRVLESMGCRVFRDPDGIAVAGGPLTAVTVDMADMPDLVPTLAVVAAFARGITVIRNVGHLAVKESDRLTAVAAELSKMGIDVRHTGDGLAITGGAPGGAVIHTYDDHRMAMSFAVAGLRVPGVVIRDPGCVAKSFPDFWEVFEGLYRP